MFFETNLGANTEKETLLWTNPSPTSAFSGGSVVPWNVISQYDAVKVVWKGAKTEDSSKTLYMTFGMQDKASYVSGYSASLGINSNPTSSTGYTRQFAITSSNGLSFGTNAQRIQDTSSSASPCIPLEIYGIK